MAGPVDHKPKASGNIYMTKGRPPSIKIGADVTITIKAKIDKLGLGQYGSDEDGYNIGFVPTDVKISSTSEKGSLHGDIRKVQGVKEED